MAFSCGFYNAIDRDRTYSATQFGEMFDGLINDGVYSTIGECFMTVPGAGMTVHVKSGRAWFNKTWSVNTMDLPLDLGMADLLLPRIDTVILEVDTRVAVRNNSLKVIHGYPAVDPIAPALTNSDGLYQYPLANISVKANASAIEKTDIEIVVGKDPCPFVTGILQSVDITDMFQQWEGQFEDWFAEIKTILEGDVVGNILYQLDQKVNKSDKATAEDALLGTDDTKWMTPKMVKTVVDPVSVPVGGIIMWSGTVSNIPSGWHLCDGTDGTPDLRNRFVMGAGSSYSPGSTGGKSSATVSAMIGKHTHGILNNIRFSNGDMTTSQPPKPYYQISWRELDRSAARGLVYTKSAPSKQGVYETIADSVMHYPSGASSSPMSGNVPFIESVGTNSSQSINTIPPFYALCYIMFLGQ